MDENVHRALPLLLGFLIGCGSTEAPAPRHDDGIEFEARLARAEAKITTLEQRLDALEVSPSPTPRDRPAARPSRTRVEITVEPSRVLVDDEEVAAVALRAHLEGLRARNPEASVIIRAEDSTENARVTKLMTAIKSAGFERISIATASDE